MPRVLTVILSLAALSACSSESMVLHNTGKTVELTGGPPSIHTTAQGIEFHQSKADELCRESGYSRAQSAGMDDSAFIASYLYSCVE